MKHELDLKNFQIRSDLVVDLFNLEEEQQGIKINRKEKERIKIIDIIIEKEDNALSKKPGRYLTISFEDVTDTTNRMQVTEVFIDELKKLLSSLALDKDQKCLVIGLGNQKSTPDALGPKTIEQILVTKYLFDIKEIEVEKGYRNVSAFTPGVMGTTGMESSDLILGIVEKTKPDFLIVVDALASSSIDRINKTIQITDTGIHPGAGIGSSHKEISLQTIGIPVIAIGIPTVIDALTIVSDTIHYLLQKLSYNKATIAQKSKKLAPATMQNYLDHEADLSDEEKRTFLGMVGLLKEEEMKELIFEVLTPIGYNLMVTPKEVDFVIEKLSEVIANGINESLHKNIKKLKDFI